MPELYRLADNTHVNTQADAKHSGLPFEKVDVPTTRKELLAYLNEIANSCRSGSPQETPPAAEPQESEREVAAPAPAPTPAPTSFAPTVVTVSAIEEFILDKATVAQIGNIFECLGTRFAELRKIVREAAVDD